MVNVGKQNTYMDAMGYIYPAKITGPKVQPWIWIGKYIISPMGIRQGFCPNPHAHQLFHHVHLAEVLRTHAPNNRI